MTASQGAGKPAPKIDQQRVEQEVSWIGARLREPSTYAGLGIVLTAIFHLSNAARLASDIESIGVGLGMIIGGVLAMVLPESAGKTARLPVPGYKDNATAAIALCVLAALASAPRPAHAAARQVRTAAATVPLPLPRPLFDSARTPSTKPTVAQAQQNPLLVLQQFTVADLQAALKDAQSQTPPDAVAANCYAALIPFVQQQTLNPLPAGPGVFQALQKARDAKAYLANIQSPTGPLASLNQACAPLVLDVQNTLLTLGVSVGVIANPAGATAALTGLPAAVAAFLHLPPL